MGNEEKQTQSLETWMYPECEDCFLGTFFVAFAFQLTVFCVSLAKKGLLSLGGSAGKGVGLCETSWAAWWGPHLGQPARYVGYQSVMSCCVPGVSLAETL